MGTIQRKCSCMVCASDVVREGIELRRPCGSTYVRRCTQTTLDVGVQEAAHQAPIAFSQELQDLDSQWLSETKKYVQKIEDLQAWEGVQE
jgi:hypothetical protein